MSLLSYITKNTELLFLDAQSKDTYTFQELLFPLDNLESVERKLVFLYMDNSIDSIASYFSFMGINYTLVLLSNGLNDELKENLEKEYSPNIIFDSSQNTKKGYKSIEVESLRLRAKYFTKEDVKQAINTNCKVLLSTSGTTGSPKFVKLSNDNLLENAKSISDYLPINSKDITPLNLPLNYSYGLSVLHSNAICGGKIVCGLPDILQRDFWKLLDDYEFTSIAGVPYIYEMLQRIGFHKKKYPSLRYMSQAGGNLSSNIKKIFLEYSDENDIELYIMYGQTEATARISYVPPKVLAHKLTSIGKPIKNGTLNLDPETNELLYSGPNVFGGYAERKEDLAIWDTISVLKTGDIGKIDDEGYFYIVGRLKRFVKVYGNRINLDEVEKYIKTTYSTSLLACIGVDDKFILISHNDEQIEDVELKKSIFDKYKIHHTSIKIQHLEELPLTSNGKIDYKKIRADYN